MRASWSPRPVFAFFAVALEPLEVVAALPEASSSGLLLFIVVGCCYFVLSFLAF